MLFVAMHRRAVQPLAAALLGLFLVLGMSVSAAQATEMALASAAGTDASQHHGCDGCTGDDGTATAATCLTVCTTPMPAVMLGGALLRLGRAAPATPTDDVGSRGRWSEPEPYPPRSSIG